LDPAAEPAGLRSFFPRWRERFFLTRLFAAEGVG